MRKQFFKYFLLFVFLAAGVCNEVYAQNLQAEAKLQQTTIRIGDQTRLQLIVHQPAKAHVDFPRLPDTITSKLQVISAGKPDTLGDSSDRSLITIIKSYVITSFDAGTYIIPSYSFASGTEVTKTNELTLQVQSVRVDTTKGIYDIKKPLTVTYTVFDWLKDNWFWVLITLAGIGLIAGLMFYLIKRPKKQPAIKKLTPVLPPHVIALEQLARLREKNLWQQDEIKPYYSELTGIIREYLEKRYLIRTHERTSDEILSDLEKTETTADGRNKLRHLFALADLVKFAKQKPSPADNQQSMQQAVDFVTATQTVAIPDEREEGSADV